MSDRESEWWDDLAELNPECVIFDGPGAKNQFDDCIIGYATRMSEPALIVYDEDLMVETMMNEGMDYTDAIEYLSFNTWGAWLGDHTPLILRRYTDGRTPSLDQA